MCLGNGPYTNVPGPAMNHINWKQLTSSEREVEINLTVYQLDIYYTIFYGICKELFFSGIGRTSVNSFFRRKA